MKKLRLILIAIAVITATLIAVFTNVVFSSSPILKSGLTYSDNVQGAPKGKYLIGIETLTSYNNIYCVELSAHLNAGHWYEDCTEITIKGNVATIKDLLRTGDPTQTYEGDYNNLLAAILCEGELGYGYLEAFNDSQVALYYYWNTWVGEIEKAVQNAGNTKQFKLYRGSKNLNILTDYDKSTWKKYDVNKIFAQYQKHASEKSYNVTITYFEDSSRQNLILVERGGTTSKSISIPVEKRWNDSGNAYSTRPSSIKVNLYLNGTYTGKSLTLNAGNSWKGTFTELDDKPGYTVVEESITGYNTSYYGSQSSTFYISNTLQTTSVSITKQWQDDNNRDGKRPRNIRCNFI